MAKIELRHLCNSSDGTYIKAEVYDQDMIEIVLVNLEGYNQHIFLDKSTAIKFAKTLRTEINKIQ